MFQHSQTDHPVNKGVCGFDFEEAIQIWNLKPQVANRRLAGAINVVPYTDLTYKLDEEINLKNYLQTIFEQLCKSTEESDGGFKLFLDDHREELSAHLLQSIRFFCFNEDLVTDTRTIRFWLRKLVPRSLDRYSATYELALWKSGMFCFLTCFK